MNLKREQCYEQMDRRKRFKRNENSEKDHNQFGPTITINLLDKTKK